MREGTLSCLEIVLYHLAREITAIFRLNSLYLATCGETLLSSKRVDRSVIDHFDLCDDKFSDAAFLATTSGCSRRWLLYLLLLLIVLATGVLHRQVAIFVVAEKHEWSNIALGLFVLGKTALCHVAFVTAHSRVPTPQLSLLSQVG